MTHNSALFIDKCLDSINKQTIGPLQIIISDTGSSNLSYLDSYRSIPEMTIVNAGKDVGFCKGNNFAISKIHPEAKYVLLLNPDAFLFPDFIEKAIHYMEAIPECGICTGTLLGYDIHLSQPTGLYDSTGICCTWYGKWYDRDQRSAVVPHKYIKSQQVPAACGALMFCRWDALAQTMVEGNIFDPNFYMYKEDIDLSLRIKRMGWTVVYNPQLLAYHCRGWNINRKKMQKKYRLASARNEWIIHWRDRFSIGLIYSSMKYLAVKVFNL